MTIHCCEKKFFRRFGTYNTAFSFSHQGQKAAMHMPHSQHDPPNPIHQSYAKHKFWLSCSKHSLFDECPSTAVAVVHMVTMVIAKRARWRSSNRQSHKNSDDYFMFIWPGHSLAFCRVFFFLSFLYICHGLVFDFLRLLSEFKGGSRPFTWTHRQGVHLSAKILLRTIDQCKQHKTPNHLSCSSYC